MSKITVGLQLSASNADYGPLKDTWMEADELGADAIYAYDHFFPPSFDPKVTQEQLYGKCFEAMTLQSAMAATTKRAQIGCLVLGNSYRNPHLVADMARTIDHISNGRFILGVGAGWYELDYKEYGYPFEDAPTRLKAFGRDLKIMKERMAKLNPQPVHKIPFLIGGGGEKVTLKLVAQYADIWHGFGDIEGLKRKLDILREHCQKVGRDFNTITLSTSAGTMFGRKVDPEPFAELGFTHFIAMTGGPKLDLGGLKVLLDYKKSVG